MNPGNEIRRRLEVLGWTQADLASVMGRTVAAVSELIQCKRRITVESATLLSGALGETPAYWLALDAAHRGDGNSPCTDVERRRRLYELAPIREMVRRGWIVDTDSPDELEQQLKSFFGVVSFDTLPEMTAAMRKGDSAVSLTPAQRAWCFRAKNLASKLIVNPFFRDNLPECLVQLQPLMAFPPEARHVALKLGEYGIRFVVVEHLSGSKIDGAAMWLDEEKPVIALSLRLDRIDNFWFTLLHELSHIIHGDGLSVDSELTDDNAGVMSATKSPIERRADNEAASMLIAPEVLTSFIQRVGPLYSKSRINQFAHRIKVHPGIIVGQLRHCGEMSYRVNNEMVAKVREHVAASSLTDGWGNIVS